MTGATPAETSRPRFSIVSAVYDVEPYLPEFIRSIERQRIAAGDLEVIAVDDGSTDGSLDLLIEWARSSRHRVKVFTKPNGGQGSARNLGLGHATAEWVTFTDPDDVLDRDFFRAAGRFAAAHPDIALMAAKPVSLREDIGRVVDDHPRRHQYRLGNRVANLIDEPNVFPGSSTVCLFRPERIRARDLRFDDRVRPNFEDGHFTVGYLLSLEEPRVGLLRDARYLYRRRVAGTSTLQRSLRDPGRYTNVLEYGYLGAMGQARDQLGHVPAWLQQVVVYELSWYFGEDEKISSKAELSPATAARFHELLAQIVAQLEPAVVCAPGVRRLRSVWLDVLAHGARDAPWHSAEAARTRVDEVMGVQRIQYRFAGPMPSEAFTLDGAAVRPAFAKTMAHRYYGRDLLYERILWLPAGEALALRVAGDEMPVVDGWPPTPRPEGSTGWGPRIAWYRDRPVPKALAAVTRRVLRLRRRAVGASLRLAARCWPWPGRFADAWLVMDRIHDADDSGERLFEHLRIERPEINAWFVLERNTPDWRRMAARGEARLLAHGSFTWQMAMLNCRWLVSSHADVAIYRPPQLASTGRSTWRFAFLQHGVTKDDLSRWLNGRDLELFVVSTAPELESVAGDGTAYRFTARETRNTGLPRFDRLLREGSAVAAAERNLVIVAPTWREWLTLPLASGSQRRELDAVFWESEYIRSWDALLRSAPIARAIERRGWRLGFMPHPNLQAILGEMNLPGNIEQLSFVGTDVQALYARCALLVTDYSSVAFNAAYLDRPVVYYQFDRVAMLRGAHVGRQGYFDYSRDGFGPVVDDLEGAEEAIVAAIEHGPSPTPAFTARIASTFPVRDGRCCERVVAAIEELSRPYGAPAG